MLSPDHSPSPPQTVTDVTMEAVQTVTDVTMQTSQTVTDASLNKYIDLFLLIIGKHSYMFIVKLKNRTVLLIFFGL